MRIFFSILLLVSVAARSATYYVATTGSDTGAGTVGDPWLTIQRAATNATAGDTINIGAGTFAGWSSRSNGTAGNLVSVVGTFPNTVVTSIVTLRHDYQRIAGLIVSNSMVDANYNQSTTRPGYVFETNLFLNGQVFGSGLAMLWSGRTDGITIRSNTFETTIYPYGEVTPVMVAIQGDGLLVTNNQFRNAMDADALRITRAFGGSVVGNLFTNIWSDGQTTNNHADVFQSFTGTSERYGVSNIVFERNFIVDSGAQLCNLEDQYEGSNPGIMSSGGWVFRNNVVARSLGRANIYFQIDALNNTFYETSEEQPWQLKTTGVKGNASGSRIIGNAFKDSTANTAYGNWSVNGSLTNITILNNYAAGTNWSSKDMTGGSNNLTGTNALWVDPDNLNFQLQSTSPLIGAGANLSAEFTTDYAGATRSAPWDIGAYEYSAGGGGGGGISLRTVTARIGRVVKAP